MVNAGPTKLPVVGVVRRCGPYINTLRNPRVKSCVHSVAVLIFLKWAKVVGFMWVRCCLMNFWLASGNKRG